MTRTRLLLLTIALLLTFAPQSPAELRPWLLSNIGPDGGEPLLDLDGNPYTGNLIVHVIADMAGNGPNAPQPDGPDIGLPSGDDVLVGAWVISTPMPGLHPAGAFSLYNTYDYVEGQPNPTLYVRVYDGVEITPSSRIATSQLFSRPAYPASAQTVLEFSAGFSGYLGNTAPAVSIDGTVDPITAGSMLELQVSATDDEPVEFSVLTDALPGEADAVQILPGDPGTALIRWATPVGAVGTHPFTVLAHDGHLYGSATVNVEITAPQVRPSSFQLTAPIAGATLWDGNQLAWTQSVHPVGQPINYTVIWSLNEDFSDADSLAGITDRWVDVLFVTPPTADSRSGRGDELGAFRTANRSTDRETATLSRASKRDRGERARGTSARNTVTSTSSRTDRDRTPGPVILEDEPVIESEISIAANDGDTVYWVVRAVAGGGSQRLSPASSVIAERPDAPSAVPGLLLPDNDAALTTTEPFFSWEAASDGDIGDTLTYDLRWSADNGASWDTVKAIPGTEFDMSGEVFHLVGAGALRDWITSAALQQAGIQSVAGGGTPAAVGGSSSPQIDSERGGSADVSALDRSGTARSGRSAVPTKPQATSVSANKSGRDNTPTALPAAEIPAPAPSFARASAGRLGDPGQPVTDDVSDNATILWTVDAVDATGLRTPAAETRTFTVDAPSSPTPFDLVFPADSVWVREVGPVTLRWTESVDADPDPLTYDVLGTTDPDLTDPVDFPVLASGLTTTEFELTSEDDRAWRWTVRAVEAGDTTWMSGGPARLYLSRQDAPAEFALLSPADEAVIADLNPALTWQVAIDDDLNDSLSYTLSWSLDGWLTADSLTGLSDTSVVLADPFPDDAVVSWRVRAIDTNSDGRLASGGGWTFSTFVNDPPEPFALSTPENGSTLDSELAEFSWQPSSDPEAAGDLAYTLYVSEDMEFTEPDIYDAGTDTAYAIDAWNVGVGERWWKVTVEDATGLTTESEVWTFIVPATGVAGLMSDMPTEFALAQAYPNPFNPVVTVVMAVPKPGSEVQLVMHDILGRQVVNRTLSGLSAGYHTLTLDLTGHASGPYFLQMAAEGRTVESRRVTYLK